VDMVDATTTLHGMEVLPSQWAAHHVMEVWGEMKIWRCRVACKSNIAHFTQGQFWNYKIYKGAGRRYEGTRRSHHICLVRP